MKIEVTCIENDPLPQSPQPHKQGVAICGQLEHAKLRASEQVGGFSGCASGWYLPPSTSPFHLLPLYAHRLRYLLQGGGTIFRFLALHLGVGGLADAHAAGHFCL